MMLVPLPQLLLLLVRSGGPRGCTAECFRMLQNASKCSGMLQNASKCFKLLQNASECFNIPSHLSKYLKIFKTSMLRLEVLRAVSLCLPDLLLRVPLGVVDSLVGEVPCWYALVARRLRTRPSLSAGGHAWQYQASACSQWRTT